MAIKELKNSIVLENEYSKIELSKKDASALSIKAFDGSEILDEKKPFFHMLDSEWREIENRGLCLEGDVLVLDSAVGKAKIRVLVRDKYFIFEGVCALPEKAFCLILADASYEYDIEAPDTPRAVGVAMTVGVDPRFFPDGYKKKTQGRIYEHLEGALGARYGYSILPENLRRETLKLLCSEIDPEKGIVSRSAGAWSDENEKVQGSYMLSWYATKEYLDDQIDALEILGIKHLDIVHNDIFTFRQGDFKYATYKDDEDFKHQVTDRLAERGIETGLHTYAQYINPKCHELLSNPYWQKQLSTREEFTLGEDVSAEACFIPSAESTESLSTYYGFFSTNMPYILVDEEIIKYTNAPNGFTVTQRGACGTKPAAHKKGARIYHLDGDFYLLAPKHGSELFLKIARDTANAYNKGGYSMVYIDAIDGTRHHCGEGESYYYIAKFTHEIMKHCHDEPIIELSDMPPSVWACRARMGAWDIPFRGLKRFNLVHHKYNAEAVRHLYNATLGWVCLYPQTDKYPGNQHTKYFHTDAIEQMGALALVHNYSIAYSNYNVNVAGWRRNLEIYKLYDKLRREHYFKPETLKKARESEHELAILDKGRGKYAIVEKNYEVKRLYDIGDEKRNSAYNNNPFKKQVPFIRIENCMSTLGRDPLILLPLKEDVEVKEQLGVRTLASEMNLMNHLAMKVRVKGNGKKGNVALRLKGGTQSEKGYGLYVIDTDFEGWREFVLLEADNGDRPDLPYEDGLHMYPIYRSGLNMDRINHVELISSGDVDGVFVSSITACRQVYNVVKNPKVTIGEESVKFECELQSSDFIEWNGKEAKVVDRHGNEKKIWFEGSVTAPRGKYTAKVTFASSLNNCPVNVYLTVGTTGKEIK